MRIVEITMAFPVHAGGMFCPALTLRREHDVPQQSKIIIDVRKLKDENPNYNIEVQDGFVVHYTRNDGQDVHDEITVSVFVEPIKS